MPSDPPAAPAVPDTQLGLSSEEISLLRQGQAALATSTSSRAASRASSQAGLLLLDPSSLAALGRHFDHVMAGIETHITRLSEQAAVFTAAQFDAAGALIAGADAEIERYTRVLGEIDELEMEFDRITHIRQIVREYRARVEALDRDLERSGGNSARPSGSGSGGAKKKHSSSSHGHKSKKK